MNLQLHRRFALVMGGSSGLGLAVARSLAQEGVSLCLLSSNEEKLNAATTTLQKYAVPISYIVTDFTSPDSVSNTIAQLQKEYPSPDIIIGNGGGPKPGPATTFNQKDWETATSTMLFPIMRLVDTFLPHMRQKQFGRIIMISSSSINEPIPNLVLSNALRSALASWSKTLAREVAYDGITVNTLMPGRFDTERTIHLNHMRADKTGLSVDEIKQKKEQEIPTGRYGNPDEFGYAATFLASPRASYITGARIPVDGGLLRGN